MKKKLLMMVMCAVLTIGLTACGAKYADTSMENNRDIGGGYESDWTEPANGPMENNPDSNSLPEGEYSQKLILRYSLEYQSKDFDKSYAYIENKVKEFNGYIEDSHVYGYIDRTANLVLRIPTAKVEEFPNDDSALGTKVNKSQSAEDITLQYYDVKARLETLNTKRERLLELLQEAKDVADIITIEDQLSQCEYEINSYTTTMKLYDNLVMYTTINLTIYEVRDIEAVGEDSVMQRIGKGFVANFHDVCDRVVDFCVWFITSIPYFILLLIAVLILLLIVKLIIKLDRKHTEKKRLKKEKTGGVINCDTDNKDNK